jgi:hypothetical protein
MEPKERSALMNSYCAPLFIGEDYLADGHDEKTISATVTFVRFNGVDSAVTCRHVSDEAYKSLTSTARIHFGRAVIRLKEFKGKSFERSLMDVDGDKKIDLSITAFGNGNLETISETSGKPKSPIDLDNFQAVIVNENDMGLAVGFPDEHKSLNGKVVESPMVEAIVAFNTSLEPGQETFALHSTLDKPSEFGLSGISGGPIFALDTNGSPLPCGIVFEGHPSAINYEASSSSAFFNSNDLFIRGYSLTPTTFEAWLEGAGF